MSLRCPPTDTSKKQGSVSAKNDLFQIWGCWGWRLKALGRHFWVIRPRWHSTTIRVHEFHSHHCHQDLYKGLASHGHQMACPMEEDGDHEVKRWRAKNTEKAASKISRQLLLFSRRAWPKLVSKSSLKWDFFAWMYIVSSPHCDSFKRTHYHIYWPSQMHSHWRWEDERSSSFRTPPLLISRLNQNLRWDIAILLFLTGYLVRLI